MVAGLPGSGKSYFASRLADRLGAVYLSSDRIRKTLFPQPTYTSEEKEQIYEEMARRMEKALVEGKRVVLDSTFYLKSIRGIMRQRAASIAVKIHFLYIQADEETVRRRTQKKREDSDADYAVHLSIKALFEPIEMPCLTLNSTDENLAEMMEMAWDYLNRQDD